MWIPELEQNSPHTAFVLLVGLKMDLRNDPELLTHLTKSKRVTVSVDDLKTLAAALGAVGFVETETLASTGQGRRV